MPFLSSAAATLAYGRPQAGGGGGSGPSGSLKVNVIGDSSIGSVVTALGTARTSLGYNNVSITYTQTNLSGYTGSDLTTANYDVLVVYTNGGLTFNANFGTNLNAYIAAGGKVVFGVFMWGNVTAITNFTYTNSPYAYKGTQSTQTATMTVTQTHPITTGLPTTIAGSGSFYTPSVVVQSDATSIASFPDGTSMVAIQTSPKRVAVNLYPPYTSSNANQAKLTLNAILWAGGLLT